MHVGADKEACIVWMNLEVTELRLSQAQQDTNVAFHVRRTSLTLVHSVCS